MQQSIKQTVKLLYWVKLPQMQMYVHAASARPNTPFVTWPTLSVTGNF